MNGYEQQKLLNSMVILVDRREHENERAHKRYSQLGRPYQMATLCVGDYTYNAKFPDGRSIFDASCTINPDCAVERKMSLDELVACFVGKGKIRFRNELQRAKSIGCKLYLLVENATWEDILLHRYRSKMDPDTLMTFLMAYQARYDLLIIFCTEHVSGRLIKEILYRELKERLQNGEIC